MVIEGNKVARFVITLNFPLYYTECCYGEDEKCERKNSGEVIFLCDPLMKW